MREHIVSSQLCRKGRTCQHQEKSQRRGRLTASPLLIAEVAAIAAEAMDGHMMFTCKLRARVLKAADVHPDLFKVG